MKATKEPQIRFFEVYECCEIGFFHGNLKIIPWGKSDPTPYQIAERYFAQVDSWINPNEKVNLDIYKPVSCYWGNKDCNHHYFRFNQKYSYRYEAFEITLDIKEIFI